MNKCYNKNVIIHYMSGTNMATYGIVKGVHGIKQALMNHEIRTHVIWYLG